jgi:hypothetical protein
MKREQPGAPGRLARSARGGRISLRFDRPGGQYETEPVETAAESPGFLRALLHAIRSEPSDRRDTTRHPTGGADVWVGWCCGEDLVAIRGRLRDISRGGARVVVAVRPPRDGSVWLYTESNDTLRSARGEVVGHTPAPGGLFAVRLRFSSPCPTPLLAEVVWPPRPA